MMTWTMLFLTDWSDRDAVGRIVKRAIGDTIGRIGFSNNLEERIMREIDKEEQKQSEPAAWRRLMKRGKKGQR